MTSLLIGLAIVVGLLGWIIYRYSVAQDIEAEKAKEQRVKDEKYRLVLEKAKMAEREEKIFKAQTGHVQSQLSLAKEYEATNIREALYWYGKAAEQDHEIAMNAMARLCKHDIDDPHGEEKSEYWTQRLQAKSNVPEACFELGRYKIKGHGTDIDVEGGLALIHQAADAELVVAQLFLGDWYLSDQAADKDQKEAFLWRLRAALHEDVRAFKKLAYCYQAGIAVEKSRSRTVYWLERAAELRDMEAQILVAKMHGAGDAYDNAIAYIWLSQAHVSGHPSAKVERDKVVQHIGIESILGVQNVANTVEMMINRAAFEPQSVIRFLDKLYERKGYRPTHDELETLALGDFSNQAMSSQKASSHSSDEASGLSGESSEGQSASDSGGSESSASSSFQTTDWQAGWEPVSPDTSKS